MASVFPHKFGTFQFAGHGNGYGSGGLLDSDDRMAWVFRALQAMTITRVAINLAAVNGTPPTYRLSLQGVDATNGQPSGTILGGGSPASVSSNSWSVGSNWKTLTNSYACTRGELMALVVDYSSGTIDGSNNISVRTQATGSAVDTNFPYHISDGGGGWTKYPEGIPLFGYGSASRRFGHLARIASSLTVSTSGHRAAAKFTVDGDLGTTFTVTGFRAYGLATDAGSTLKIGLWNGAGTELQATSYDTDVLSQVGAVAWIDGVFDESSLEPLAYGTPYYFGFEHAGTDPYLYGYQVEDASDRETLWLPGDVIGSTWNGSSWSDDSTKIPLIELLLEEHTGGAGSIVIANHLSLITPAAVPVSY